jgi:hypothetical protein
MQALTHHLRLRTKPKPTLRKYALPSLSQCHPLTNDNDQQLLAHGETLSKEDMARARKHEGTGGDPEHHTREAEHAEKVHPGHHHGHEKESGHDHHVMGGYKA